MSSNVDFRAPLGRFAALLNLNIETVVRQIAVDALRRVVLRTPVDTGRARSSWDLTVDTYSTRVAPETGLPPGEHGGQGVSFDPMAHNAAGIAAINGRQKVYVVSNVEYIEALENGHSKQAPAGMVRVTLAEIEAEIEHIVRELERNQ